MTNNKHFTVDNRTGIVGWIYDGKADAIEAASDNKHTTVCPIESNYNQIPEQMSSLKDSHYTLKY